MEILYGKLIAALSLAVVTFLFAVLPIALVKKIEYEGSRPRNIRVVSFLSCFGGGVFMATCLLHLFPDVQEQVVSISKTIHLNENYPIAEFLLSIGFLIVMIIEQIALSYEENGSQKNITILNHQHSHGEPLYQDYGTINEQPDEQTIGDAAFKDVDISAPAAYSNDQIIEDQEFHGHEVSFHQDLSSHSILRSLLLVFALSLHSIFEGLAIGLQTTTENVIRILLAVLIHKCIIAFTLGLNLMHSKLRSSSAYKGIVFFSLTSPLGMIIGLVVVDFVTGLPMMITSVILQGLAAGTFLYVTFFEVLPHELNSNEDRMIKMGSLVLGFSAVAVLLLFFPS